MNISKINEDIYAVGILNPNMRVFDVIMTTENGTSYNSYIVKGKEKIALIEVCHSECFGAYLDNIRSVIEPEKIDYIILNHTEPDHSGALAQLLEHCPNATIVASRAGGLFLKNIVNNPSMSVKVVAEGDTIDLGGKVLSFISAPFLHWSDTMFTWIESDKALFSCDFLGCHFCEPYTFDYNISYEKAYEKSFEEYYYAIMAPFRPYVEKALDKIKGFDLEYVLTSHGPVLTKDCRIDYAISNYTKWSKPPIKDKTQIPIFYVSAYGNTEKIALAIKDGIKSVISDAQVDLFNIIECDISLLANKMNQSDGFAIGSPTINADALPPVWNLLAHIEAVNCRKKPVIAFGSFGWSGEAVPNINDRFKCLKMNVFKEGLKVCFVPTDEDLTKAYDLGKEYAENLK